MKIMDLRYLAAYMAPLTCFAGLYLGGWASPGALYFSFMFVPLVEIFVPASGYNDDEEVLKAKSGKLFFDILLYLNLPIVYGLIAYFVWLLGNREWGGFELIFSMINVGLIIGVSAINVAHELGHRRSSFDKWMARLLLLPALYSHFTTEHNYGHHIHVATPEDPATGRKGENLYMFFLRSVSQSYIHAWEIKRRMLTSEKKSAWQNEIIWAHVVQLLLIIAVFQISGWLGVVGLIGAAFIGVFILESVNYIEHYGLLRGKLPSGRYEMMNESHSWNSNHELGRIVLYELVRHSDHHYQTTRKYQQLRHFDTSPQLPYGYPGSILLALLPPVWFRVMDRLL